MLRNLTQKFPIHICPSKIYKLLVLSPKIMLAFCSYIINAHLFFNSLDLLMTPGHYTESLLWESTCSFPSQSWQLLNQSFPDNPKFFCWIF